MAMLDRYVRLAEKIEAEAAGVRSRVSRASVSSQRVMQAEAAALERSARYLRAEVASVDLQADAAEAGA
jgi:hypothetical protein